MTTGGVTVNRFCASGLEAVNLAAAKVASGFDDLVLAGGVESMSRVPMGSDGGALFADPTTAYDNYINPQGIGADLIATIEGFSREDVDGYAAESQARAARAIAEGRFVTQEELDKHLKMLDEAKARDHRKLGEELQLFTFSEDVGKGLPLMMPRGSIVKNLLSRYMR